MRFKIMIIIVVVLLFSQSVMAQDISVEDTVFEEGVLEDALDSAYESVEDSNVPERLVGWSIDKFEEEVSSDTEYNVNLDGFMDALFNGNDYDYLQDEDLVQESQ